MAQAETDPAGQSPLGERFPQWKTVQNVKAGRAAPDRAAASLDPEIRRVGVTGVGDWKTYLTLETGAAGYAQHTFPAGFSAYWIRVVARQRAVVTAQLFYT